MQILKSFTCTIWCGGGGGGGSGDISPAWEDNIKMMHSSESRCT